MTRSSGTIWIFLAFVMLLPAVTLTRPAPAVAAEPAPVAKAARLNGDAGKVRFVADITYAVSYNVYVLPDPYRVIIDLPEVNFQIPPSDGTAHAGFIEGFRYGLVDAGRSRIVLDANAPVLIKKSFVMRARGDQPARIVVDLVSTDAASFMRVHRADEVRLAAAMEELPPISANSAEPPQSADVTEAGKNPIIDILTRASVPLPRPKPQIDSGGKKREVRVNPASQPVTRHVIVIDPGHGGIDPGTISADGVDEKDVVLAFAKVLKQKFEADKRFKVVMSRGDDHFVTLRDRVKFARDHNAELFISLHADSVKSRFRNNSSARGATVYTLSDRASDSEAEALAQKENRADIIAGVDLGAQNDEVTGILIDLAQRDTKNRSVYFAKSLVEHLHGKVPLHRRPLRAAGFQVLKAPDVPSVLVELGYLSNRHDEKLLTSEAWREKTAAAMVEAMAGYFAVQIASGR